MNTFLQFRQIHLQFEKIHFTTLRNTFFNLDKYILLDKKSVLAPGVCSHVANTTLGEDSQGNSHGVLSGHQIHNRNFQNFYKSIIKSIDQYKRIALELYAENGEGKIANDFNNCSEKY